MQRTRSNGKRIILNILPYFILFILVLIDKLTKLHFNNLYENTDWKSTTVINNFFYFTYTQNSGAGFSFLADKSWGQLFFKILTAPALLLFVIILIKSVKKNKKWLIYSMIFVIAGTIGKYIYRLIFNKVSDFIALVFGSYHFPVFNIADVCLTIGAIMAILYVLFISEDGLFRRKPTKKDGNKEDINN